MDEVEPQDLTPHLALIVASLSLAGLVASILLVLWLRPDSPKDRDLHAAVTPLPAPALQTDPAADMERFRAEERRVLESYGWIDRQRGVVRIPVEAAMRRVVRDGIPGWPAP